MATRRFSEFLRPVTGYHFEPLSQRRVSRRTTGSIVFIEFVIRVGVAIRTPVDPDEVVGITLIVSRSPFALGSSRRGILGRTAMCRQLHDDRATFITSPESIFIVPSTDCCRLRIGHRANVPLDDRVASHLDGSIARSPQPGKCQESILPSVPPLSGSIDMTIHSDDVSSPR